MTNNENTRNSDNTFNMEQCSADIYVQNYINVADQRFAQELQEVVEGSKVVEDISMICDLRQALSVEVINANDQNEVILQLLNINQDIAARIIETVERFIDNIPICISSDSDTNENMSTIESEHTLYTQYFNRILNGLTLLFNVNHRILIQLIEQNYTERSALVITQCEEYYKAIVRAIEQNRTFETCPIILAIAHESYRRLRLPIQVENNIRIPQVSENDCQTPTRCLSTMTLTSWYIIITGITMLATFLITGNVKIMMSIIISFILLSILSLLNKTITSSENHYLD